MTPQGPQKDTQDHVGFVAGVTPDNKNILLGGNQYDQANLSEYPRSYHEASKSIELRYLGLPTGCLPTGCLPVISGGYMEGGRTR